MKSFDVHEYDDILNLPHHTSKVHPKMSRLDRAAQFAPFAALTGHKEALIETARITEEKKVLDENLKAMLDETLQEIQLRIKTHPKIKITYFQMDEFKSGGAYVTHIKEVKKVDEYYQTLNFMDKTIIKIDDVYAIEIIESSDI